MDKRPDPDQILARLKEDELREKRGRLKVFFGAAPGVGKTYAMLEAARVLWAEGVDVVAGWVETHGRKETIALLDGLEVLPSRLLSYKGKELREFDLDAALERRPTVLLVDELAHTNAPGSRHAKRWKDVQELLSSGISVYTTLNVQHLESLHDVVAQITGVKVAERVPDAVMDEAHEVELVDLPPDDLIKRMKEGKVYFPEMAEQAMHHFFRAGNLIALREMALRRTAERVDMQMQRYREEHAVRETWPVGERIAVCLGPSPYGQRLVRSVKLLASRLKAEWLAVYVETPAHARLNSADREQIDRTLRLVEQLGGEAVTLAGENTAEELIAYARSRNVSKIVLGKPPRPRWWMPFKRSFVEDLIRDSGDIDIHILGKTPEERLARIRRARRPAGTLRSYVFGLGVVAGATLTAGILNPFVQPVNIAMVYLAGVALVASRFGTGPSVVASVLSVALFDFLFVPPYLSFAVSDSQYVISFTVFLVVALLVSNLTARVKAQAERAREAQARTQAMFELTQDIAKARSRSEVADAAARHLFEHYGAQSAIFLSDGSGGLAVAAEVEASFALRSSEASVARWVYERGQPAGLDTDTLPGSDALYLPLRASDSTVGVIGIRPMMDPDHTASDKRQIYEAVANQAALALARADLAERARKSQMEAESERLRSTLLSAISHDFRTPLASILGAASTLASSQLSAQEARELSESIAEEAERLSRMVTNLLAMTRLESGAIQLHPEAQPLEEVVGSAVGRLRKRLEGRALKLDIPASLPEVNIDGPLAEQLLLNLLENALKYTPPGSPIELSAVAEGPWVRLRLGDRGPGLPEGEEARVFEKFFRRGDRAEGAGLGLAICQAIAKAHGGDISAENRPGGGALFTVSLPRASEPPPPPAKETP